MKVRLLVPRASNEGAQNIGDVIEVSAEESASMIGAGQAEILRENPPERAVSARKSEKAAR